MILRPFKQFKYNLTIEHLCHRNTGSLHGDDNGSTCRNRNKFMQQSRPKKCLAPVQVMNTPPL